MSEFLSGAVASLQDLVSPWATFYAAHALFSTAIIAAHVLSIFSGGGIAIGADRRIMISRRLGETEARAAVQDLASTHRVVVAALSVAFMTGLLLFTSDVETFAGSPVFWIKMACVLLLLINGVRLRRWETRALSATHASRLSALRAVHQSAVASVCLWLTIVTLGIILASG